MERTLDLYYDKLIIGADLSALSYSYVNKIPIFWLRQIKPHQFKEDKLLLYNKILFLLSYEGKIPIGNNLYSIRILEENLIKATTKNNLILNIKFNKLIISDDYKLEGLSFPIISKTSNKLEVLDWFEVNSGGNHDLKMISSEEKFVNNIYFFKSNRFLFNTGKKDCCSISLIDEADIDKFEFSQTYSLFKTIKMMKESGIKGRYDKTADNFKLIKLTAIKREIYELGKNIYSLLPENIEILYSDPEDILKTQKCFSILEEKIAINI